MASSRFECPDPSVCGVKRYHDDPANCLVMNSSSAVGGLGVGALPPTDEDDGEGFVALDGSTITDALDVADIVDPAEVRTSLMSLVHTLDGDGEFSDQEALYTDSELFHTEMASYVADNTTAGQYMEMASSGRDTDSYIQVLDGDGIANTFSEGELASIKKRAAELAIESRADPTSSNRALAFTDTLDDADNVRRALSLLHESHMSDFDHERGDDTDGVQAAAERVSNAAIHDATARAIALSTIMDSNQATLSFTNNDSRSSYYANTESQANGQARRLAAQYGISTNDVPQIADAIMERSRDDARGIGADSDYVGIHISPGIQDLEEMYLNIGRTDAGARAVRGFAPRAVLQFGDEYVPLGFGVMHKRSGSLVMRHSPVAAELLPAALRGSNPIRYTSDADAEPALF